METHNLAIPYKDALEYYKIIKNDQPSFIFESSDTASKASRLSILGVEPILELKGSGAICQVKQLQPRGKLFFDFVEEKFANHVEKISEEEIHLNLPKTEFRGEENDRFTRQNTAQVIRELLLKFKNEETNYMGLYGALAYSFVYLYEEVERSKESEMPDFHLFLFDTVLFFNHLSHSTSIYCTRQTAEEAEADSIQLKKTLIEGKVQEIVTPKIANMQSSPTNEKFMEQVQTVRDLCEKGEVMEVVLSRKITAEIEGDSLALYDYYKKLNPSPYMFFYDFGEEILLGASPEMMIRYESGRITLRPISGSAPRGKNTIEDHFLMMEMLNSVKEKSELDMLIDLGRNDLSKVCKPGLDIEHYRVVEKYSHIMHTVAQVSGELQEDKIGLDGLVSCLNAGTLTGAPKVAAMRYIEEMETHDRGYYGGAVGYFLFNGDVNTSIVIRSAYIKNSVLNYLTGATLLYESDPESELKETQFKAAAFMQILKQFE
ncbi:MAG: anthranilate/para-aminobenzoate synthase component I [Flammeovirgaceae bacterium]|jgi:anthranilate/para-aminobenzoate synthase component I